MKFNDAYEKNGCFFASNGTPRNPKKMTGTRLGKVLNLNPWGTPFQAWCEIMRVAEPPFEGNKYTEAGQKIEPKLLNWCKEIVSPYIVNPTEYFGDTYGVYDYFPESMLFGGMWDGLAFARKGVTSDDFDVPIAVIEAKTTSRPQDWEHGVPEHYAVQGMMYAHLLGVTDVYFPVAFLTPEDYEHPERFECTEDNTRVFHMTVNDGIGEFSDVGSAMDYAASWWEKHIDGNESPEYNERKDKEYIALIRRCELSQLTIDVDDLESLCNSLNEIDNVIDNLKKSAKIDEWEEKRKDVNKAIQSIVKPLLAESDDKDSLDTDYYVFTVSKTRKVDYDKLIEDGLFDKYVTIGNTIRTKRK